MRLLPKSDEEFQLEHKLKRLEENLRNEREERTLLLQKFQESENLAQRLINEKEILKKRNSFLENQMGNLQILTELSRISGLLNSPSIRETPTIDRQVQKLLLRALLQLDVSTEVPKE
jgi:hypothetical protein